MSNLINKLEEIIADKIHRAKSKVHDKMSKQVWMAVDSKKIAEESLKEMLQILELWAYLPCCHVSGMHDPEHFQKRTGICSSQKAEAFERLCLDLGINPETKSKRDCGWCADYSHYRKGEGVKLFKKQKKES